MTFMSRFSGKNRPPGPPRPWSDAQIEECLASARTLYFREPVELANAATMYTEQAARLLDRYGQRMDPGELAAAYTAQAQARALASIAESLNLMRARAENQLVSGN